MRHVTMADKSLLLGDDAADLLSEYAAVLGRANSADSVHITAIGVDGAEVEATFLLNSGTVLMAETSTSSLPEPDNADAVQYMRDQIARREDFDIPEELLRPSDGA